MFDLLKKHFSKSVKKLTEKIIEKKISEKDIDDFFSEIEIDLIEANVAIEVIDFLKKNLKEKICNKQVKRTEAKSFIRESFEDAILEIVNLGKVDLEKIIKNKKPVCFLILGFNGAGKTISIAKLGKFLKDKGYKVVFAAGDTFRSASIEQLETYGKNLGINVIKHKYGSDSAAVIYDAIEHAKSKHIDVVLADTAGRSHADKNLMEELKKVVRVNKPDLKILVLDSLTGNDIIEQAKKFDEAVGIDTIIMTKIDTNKKGGSLLSACYITKKPILFLGTGQKFEDLKEFDPKEFVKGLFDQS
jgi:fused signal recognition particle receptor